MKSVSPLYLKALPAVFAAALFVAPAHAMSKITVGSTVGTTIGQIATALEADGYTVLEIEVEGDTIEADVILGNREFEIDVDVTTGKVLSIEDD